MDMPFRSVRKSSIGFLLQVCLKTVKERIGRTVGFVEYLRKKGINAISSRELPHRASAGRAGIGNVGKNCIMFYIDAANLWLWKMNVARIMGNTRDQKYLPDLIRAFGENRSRRSLVCRLVSKVEGMIQAPSSFRRFV